MKQICVITGGGSGMGMETAKLLGQKGYYIILVGRTISKLENTLGNLQGMGIDGEVYPGDVSSHELATAIADYAASLGTVKILIHGAGISPNMAEGETVFTINALGTVYMNEEFSRVMVAGGCIVNLAAMSAYTLPKDKTPDALYALAFRDLPTLKGAIIQLLHALPEQQRSTTAFTISKNFVIWYSAQLAVRLGKKGIRVVSISPGTFRTAAGASEEDPGKELASPGALGRIGEPKEIARMIAFAASEECSYLTGVDILYDGGTVASMNAIPEETDFQSSH